MPFQILFKYLPIDFLQGGGLKYKVESYTKIHSRRKEMASRWQTGLKAIEGPFGCESIEVLITADSRQEIIRKDGKDEPAKRVGLIGKDSKEWKRH